MTDYTYSRGWDGTKYLVENSAREVEGEHIYLSKEIETALPGKPFKLFGAVDVLTCCFDAPLEAEEQTTLDEVITAHKLNT